MPEFATLQQHAKQLPVDIAQSSHGADSVYGFFSCGLPQLIGNNALNDSVCIGVLAECLEDANDKDLKVYLLETHHIDPSPEQLDEFKCKILRGMYLLTWCKYTSTVSTYLNSKLIEFFHTELNINAPSNMEATKLDASLLALSQYCSYVFLKRTEGVFSRLHQRLGESIQADIHEIRSSKGVIDNSWSGVFSGIMNTLGMNSMF